MCSRDQDIREKIAYAKVRLNQLSEELSQSRATEEQVEFVGQKVGDILSLCRECFDYSAKDISEHYIGKTREKSYFPMTQKALDEGLFRRLRETNPKIYELLSTFASIIEENKIYSNTHFQAGIAKEVNDLVNAKKHDRITVTKRRANSVTEVTFPGVQKVTMSQVFPVYGDIPQFGEDIDAEPMTASHPEIEIRLVPEYRLAANGWEISRYCSHAIEVTWRILEEIYAELNPETKLETFNPHEILKPAEQVRFEKYLESASHIITAPIAVEFFIGETRSGGVHFKDSYETENGMYLGDLVKVVYEMYVKPMHVRRMYFENLRENFETPEKQAFEEEHWDIVVDEECTSSIPLPDGSKIEFNRTIWHLTTRFRQTQEEGGGLIIMNQEIKKKIVLLFPKFQHQYVIGKRSLNG